MTKKEVLTNQQKIHIERHVKHHVDKHIEHKQLMSKAEFVATLFKQHVTTAIIAAFSFLIALAWKDFIVHIVSGYVGEEVINSSPYLPELITALVVTLISILGILLISSWARRPTILIGEMQTTRPNILNRQTPEYNDENRSN